MRARLFFFATAMLVTTVLLQTGCGPSAPAQNADQTVKFYVISTGGAYEFELDDGTRCVASVVGYGGGIDCDWR